LRNSIDRCGQPIKDSGCFEVALVIRILFRLLAPPFGLFFEIVPKFHMPNHVYSLIIWLSEASTALPQQFQGSQYVLLSRSISISTPSA
jgi:hypothetical protein